MAFRGRGRGRGRGFGGGGFRFAKQEAFELFPPINLPAKTILQNGQVRIEEDIDEALRYNREFRRHFKNSPYYLQETTDNNEETREIETYSNRAKRSGRFGQESLSKCGILLLEPGYFPAELLQGTKRRLAKKVRWNPKQDLRKLDFLEQLEAKLKDSTEQEDEEENEDEDNEEEDEDEEDDLGDYGKASDVDDDEDDYNDKEDGDDEPLL